MSAVNSLSQWHLETSVNPPPSPFVVASWEAQSMQLQLTGSCCHSPDCFQHSSPHLFSSAMFCLNRGRQNCTRYPLHQWMGIYNQIPIFCFIHLKFGGFFHYNCWRLSWHFPAAIYCKPNISFPSGSESIQITFKFHLCPHAIPYTHPYFLFHLTAQLLITEISSWGSLHLASSFPPRTKPSQLFLLQAYSSYGMGNKKVQKCFSISLLSLTGKESQPDLPSTSTAL